MIKNLQRALIYWVGLAVLVILAIFLIVSIKQKIETPATGNTVSFDGEGKVLAKPDVAVLDFSIVTQSPDSKSAQDANSGKSQAVTNYLKSQSVSDNDIKTTGYNIYPQYNYNNGQNNITGYQVSQTYEVKIRDLTKASDVVSGVVNAGANQVSNLDFQIDNPDKLKAQARSQAIATAKAKAQSLEGQLGIRLGRIINFSENPQGTPIPIRYSATAIGGASSGPDLSTGQNEIIIDVTLTYQIK